MTGFNCESNLTTCFGERDGFASSNLRDACGFNQRCDSLMVVDFSDDKFKWSLIIRSNETDVINGYHFWIEADEDNNQTIRLEMIKDVTGTHNVLGYMRQLNEAVVVTDPDGEETSVIPLTRAETAWVTTLAILVLVIIAFFGGVCYTKKSKTPAEEEDDKQKSMQKDQSKEKSMEIPDDQ